MLLCRPDASSIGESLVPDRTAVQSATTDERPDLVLRAPTSKQHAPAADPVADVLEWLGHYDWPVDAANDLLDPSSREVWQEEDDACDDIPTEQSGGAGASHSAGAASAEAAAQRPCGAKALDSASMLGCPPGKGPGRLLRPNPPKGSAEASPGSAPQQRGAAAPQATRSTRPPSLPRRALGDVACAPAAAGDRGRDAGKCCKPEERRDFFFEEEEEEEWEQRQRKSGTVGRLVVYHEGESPKEDVVLRGGGSRRHIVVAGVREGGQAARVGVRAGDRLVSVNGKKDFLGLSADSVRERLEAPCVLVFLGFVGKLQAEVRLTCTDSVCGISTRQDVVRGSNFAPVRLCEERVFDAGIASLFLSVGGLDDECEDMPGLSSTAVTAFPPRQQLFELQRSEACGLVRRAVKRLEGRDIGIKAGPRFAAGLTPTDGGSSPSPRPPSPPMQQARGPVAVAAADPPPPPLQPGKGASPGGGSPGEANDVGAEGREATYSSNDMALWEAENDVLARELFREDVAAPMPALTPPPEKSSRLNAADALAREASGISPFLATT